MSMAASTFACSEHVALTEFSQEWRNLAGIGICPKPSSHYVILSTGPSQLADQFGTPPRTAYGRGPPIPGVLTRRPATLDTGLDPRWTIACTGPSRSVPSSANSNTGVIVFCAPWGGGHELGLSGRSHGHGP